MLTDQHKAAKRWGVLKDGQPHSPEGGRRPIRVDELEGWSNLRGATWAKGQPWFDQHGYAKGWSGVCYLADPDEAVADLIADGVTIFRRPAPHATAPKAGPEGQGTHESPTPEHREAPDTGEQRRGTVDPPIPKKERSPVDRPEANRMARSGGRAQSLIDMNTMMLPQSPPETQHNDAAALAEAHVNLFSNSFARAPAQTLTLAQALNAIRSGVYQRQVTQVRQVLARQGKRAYDKAKANLPAFTFGGTFDPSRGIAHLRTHTGIVHGDLDHLSDVAAVKQSICADACTVYAFESPSATGLKVGVHVPIVTDDAAYKHAWQTVSTEYQRLYGGCWDPSGKDISRLCFVSHDPDLYANLEAEVFDVPPVPVRETRSPTLVRPSTATPHADRQGYAEQAIRTAVQMIEAAEVGTRHPTRLKAARLLGGYVAGGLLSEDQAYGALAQALVGHTDDLERSRKTGEDGLAYGQAHPITLEALEAERQAWLHAHRNGHSRQSRPSTNTENPTPPEGAMADKPRIRLTTELTGMVDTLEPAIRQLPHGPRLFQRARQLCGLGRGIKPPKWLRRPSDAPVILPMALAALRELATEAATWEKFEKRGKSWDATLPPPWIIETLMTRASWSFPLLEGIICTPTLRPDGTVLATPGYDEDTGLFLDLTGTEYPPLRAHPTFDDARTAIGRWQEPFLDFPFTAPCHFSATLAAILSLVARHAIQGNVPLFAVRATIRGSGKGLRIDGISVIAIGRHAPRWAQTEDQEEERKRLLTIALAGDIVLHIDNVTAPLESAPLDLALTAPTFSDRILGQQASREAPMHTVFCAPGNNMQFQGDMARRVVPIDLDPKMERPEERENFRHSPLLPWILKQRPRLVTAALTILKAYFAAGCPSQGVKPLGSFEEWSTLIRQALIWTGEADPCAGRQDIEAESDPQYEALNSLLTAWYARYGTDLRTVKQVKEDLNTHIVQEEESKRWIIHPEWRDLHGALVSLDKYGREINERAVGNALRGWKGRMVDGKRLIVAGKDRTRANIWRIEIQESLQSVQSLTERL